MFNSRSTKQNIAILVKLMQEWGIEHVVVCPGSRNAPIVHTLGNAEGFICHPVTDERSAGFVALGLSDAVKSPVAVCCTSGSALLNIAPAVAEAYYRNVPLLVISADRPKEWIGQMDGQTLVQPGAFAPHAKSYSIDEPLNYTQEWYAVREINEALASLTFNGGRPVHINVNLSEPLFDFTNDELPLIRKIEWESGSQLSSRAVEEVSSSKRMMIVVGQLTSDLYAGNRNTLNDILIKASAKGCIVLTEHLSNVSCSHFITRFDDMLADGLVRDDMKPDIVVYIGGHVVSKRLKKYLRGVSPKVCWHVTCSDSVVDLFQCVTRMVTINAVDVLNVVCAKYDSNDIKFTDAWKNIQYDLPEYVYSQWNDVSVVGNVLKCMPSGSALALANSSSVRHAQHFTLPNDVEVVCNRGVNGIEGSLSSAVGYAMASGRLTLCVIGDLSFFYDMNALWNVDLPSNLRVLVLNNSGGLIFGGLPGLEHSNHKWDFVAASHQQSAKGWVESTNARYLRVDNLHDLEEQAIDVLFGESDVPVVVEAFSDKCGD